MKKIDILFRTFSFFHLKIFMFHYLLTKISFTENKLEGLKINPAVGLVMTVTFQSARRWAPSTKKYSANHHNLYSVIRNFTLQMNEYFVPNSIAFEWSKCQTVQSGINLRSTKE